MIHFFSALLLLTSPFTSPNVQTVKGTVLSTQKYNLVNQPFPYIQCILKTESGEYSVDAGPEWYANTQGFILISGETIEASGTVEIKRGLKILIAQELVHDGQHLHLRDPSGKPLWSQ